MKGSVLELLESKESHLRDALGAKRDFASWWAVTKTWAARTQGTLPYGDCQAIAVLSAYETAAKLGLMVDGEESMVMVRGKGDRAQCRCEVGYKGVIRMAGQAGTTINARTIKAGDRIEIDEGKGTVSHSPAWLRGETAGETLGYYAVATYRDGRTVVRAMSVDAVQKRARKTEVWDKWGDEMGEKTAILGLRKVLYFGDELEALLSRPSAGFEGDSTTIADEVEDTPQHPPQTTRDKVAAAAARAQQDSVENEDQDELMI